MESIGASKWSALARQVRATKSLLSPQTSADAQTSENAWLRSTIPDSPVIVSAALKIPVLFRRAIIPRARVSARVTERERGGNLEEIVATDQIVAV